MSLEGKCILSCGTNSEFVDYDETTSTWSIVATIPYGTTDMYACTLSPSEIRAVIGRYPIRVFDRDEYSSKWMERGAHKVVCNWYTVICNWYTVVCKLNEVVCNWHKVVCNWKKIVNEWNKIVCNWHTVICNWHKALH